MPTFTPVPSQDLLAEPLALKADETDLEPIATTLNGLQASIDQTFLEYLKEGTESALANVAAPVNTSNKRRGSVVIDPVTGTEWHARGPGTGDDWYDPKSETRIFGRRYYRTIRPGVGPVPFVMLVGGQSYAVGNSNDIILHNAPRPEVTIFSPNAAITTGNFVPWDLETAIFLGNADPDTGAPGFNATTGQDNNFAAQLAWLLNDYMQVPIVVILCARSNTGLTGQELVNFTAGHNFGPTNGWVGGLYEVGGPNDSDLEQLQHKIVSRALSLLPGNPQTIDLMVWNQGQTSEVNAGTPDDPNRYYNQIFDYRGLLLDRPWFNEDVPWIVHQVDRKIELTNVKGVRASIRRLHDDPQIRQIRVTDQGGGSLFDGLHPVSEHYRTMAERDFGAMTGNAAFPGNAPNVGTTSQFIAAEWPAIPFDVLYDMPPTAGNEDVYGSNHSVSVRLNGMFMAHRFFFDITTIGNGQGPLFLPVYPALVPYWPGSTENSTQIQFLTQGGNYAFDLAGTVFAGGRIKLQRALYGSTSRLIGANPAQVSAGNVASGQNGLNFELSFSADDPRFAGIEPGDPAYFAGFAEGQTDVAGIPVNQTVYVRPNGVPLRTRPILPGNVNISQDNLNFTATHLVTDTMFAAMQTGDVVHLRPDPANTANRIQFAGVDIYETNLYWSRVSEDEPRNGRLHRSEADAIAKINPVDLTGVGGAGQSMGTLSNEVYIPRSNRILFFYPTEADAQNNTNRIAVANAPGAIGLIGFLSFGEAPPFAVDSLDKRVVELVQGNPPDALVSGLQMILTVNTVMQPNFYNALIRDLDSLGASRVA